MKIFYFAYISNPLDYGFKGNVGFIDFFVCCIIYPFLLMWTNAGYLKVGQILRSRIIKAKLLDIILIFILIIWFFIGAFINYFISHFWVIPTELISVTLFANGYNSLHPFLTVDWNAMLRTESVLLVISYVILLWRLQPKNNLQ
jgi:TM2 domain-containing membrane protein YozV